MKFRLLKYILTFFIFLNIPLTAFSEISESQPMHHFFNSRLLAPNEKKVAIPGNSGLGITENFEVGTNLLFDLILSPNLSVKHRMFHRPTFETSFTGQIFYLQLSSSSSNSDKESDSYRDDSETKEEKQTYVIFPFGIITTFDLSKTQALSVGLLDVYLHANSTDLDTKINFHIITPTLAYDHIFTKSWGLSAVLAYPVYLRAEIESDVLDAKGSMDLVSSLPGDEHPMLGFLTLTNSYDIFNIEFGLFCYSAAGASIFANAIWRWK